MSNTLLLIAIAGMLNQQNQDLIDFLNGEIKVLKEIFVKKRIKFNNKQRAYLAHKFKKISSESIRQQELLVTPETMMNWYRYLIKKKWDYSKNRKAGRPKISEVNVKLVLKLIEENPYKGDKDISNKLKNLGIKLSAQSVKNIREKYGIPPLPERNKNGNWEKFIKANWNTLVAMDFKTVEVQCSNSLELETYYVLFAIKLSTREVKLCGITRYPKEDWMLLVGNSLTDPIDGFFLENKKCIIDNDVIFTKKFCNLLKDSKIDTVKTIIKAPNMNTFIERFIRTYKYEVLQWVIPSSVNHLRTITKEWLTHYNTERNHQGIDDHIIKPQDHVGRSNGEVLKISRLNGVLNYYYRASA
jgi:putative transposase